MNPYNFLESIDNQTIFFYVVIILVFLLIFKNRNIGLNIILALIISGIFISYFYSKKVTTSFQEEERYQKKLNSIRPQPLDFEDKRDIIDFLFSIQDMYVYNPPAYEEMVENLTAFFQVYRDMKTGVSHCGYHYQIAESKKQNALNNLHSTIYTIPDDKQATDKYNRAHKRLDTLLTVYMNELYNICNDKILKNGLNWRTKFIEKGPRAKNYFTDDQFQFY